jgi:hypothetical protein
MRVFLIAALLAAIYQTAAIASTNKHRFLLPELLQSAKVSSEILSKQANIAPSRVQGESRRRFLFFFFLLRLPDNLLTLGVLIVDWIMADLSFGAPFLLSTQKHKEKGPDDELGGGPTRRHRIYRRSEPPPSPMPLSPYELSPKNTDHREARRAVGWPCGRLRV